MEFQFPPKHFRAWRLPLILMTGVLFILSIAATFPGMPSPTERAFWYWLGGLFFLLAFATATLTGLALICEAVKNLQINREKLDQSLESLNRQRTLLMQISQGIRLTDSAKEIVFRDFERLELGETVLGKLHQHDFEAAGAMIELMKEYPRYRPLSEQLSRMAERYRTATEEGRISQIISHIEGLMERNLWAPATVQIETLQSMFPYSEKAKVMSMRLQEQKNHHKRKLLAEWDQAVKNKQTDRGLEILKELDMYLTPSEALALQESASSVFKTKLHNLGVEFSVAVTEKNWKLALTCGREIVQNFPNSRMASEIRGKMDILQERASQLQAVRSS